MGEVKTAPVRARHVSDKHTFLDQRIPGSFRVVPHGDHDVSIWYCCPCGCGDVGPLLVGDGYKPVMTPSWRWNGSFDEPTLEPSVHYVGHWHGWLRGGMWESC